MLLNFAYNKISKFVIISYIKINNLNSNNNIANYLIYNN